MRRSTRLYNRISLRIFVPPLTRLHQLLQLHNGMPVERMTLSMFADHVDNTFNLNLGEASVDMTLVEAVPRKPTPKGLGVPDAIRDDPFSLLFRGPVDMPLEQRLYPVTHEKMGELVLFLVPVGIDERGRYYEALFN